MAPRSVLWVTLLTLLPLVDGISSSLVRCPAFPSHELNKLSVQFSSEMPKDVSIPPPPPACSSSASNEGSNSNNQPNADGGNSGTGNQNDAPGGGGSPPLKVVSSVPSPIPPPPPFLPSITAIQTYTNQKGYERPQLLRDYACCCRVHSSK